MSKQPTIAVFGDSFRDIYWIGTTSRLSPEVPVPVVNISDNQSLDGGASNVQQNLIALGVKTWTPTCYFDTNNYKNRLICNGYQLARWDENDSCPEITKTQVDWVRNFQADGIIISDYNKGAITYETIEAIAALNLPTFIDSKRNPRDFDVIMNPVFFPNEKEYQEHLNDYKLQPQVVYKRGAQGMQYQQFGYTLATLPTWAEKVVSVCGAGDTVIAAYAYKYFSSTSVFDALEFANAAAAVVVQKPYTATATLKEIQDLLETRCLPLQLRYENN